MSTEHAVTFICRIEGIEGTGLKTWRPTPRGRTLILTKATTQILGLIPGGTDHDGNRFSTSLIAHILWLRPATDSSSSWKQIRVIKINRGRNNLGTLFFLSFFCYFFPLCREQIISVCIYRENVGIALEQHVQAFRVEIVL